MVQLTCTMMPQPRHGECFPASITILYYAAGVYFHTPFFPLKYGFIIVHYDEAILQRKNNICTMMKPYFKGKTASTKPMYSRNVIHPREYENTPQLHSKVQCLWWGKHSPMSELWHHSTSQLYYGFLMCMGCTHTP